MASPLFSRLSCCSVSLLFCLSAFPPQDTRPLPDRATFVREARERLRLDDQLLAPYAYTQRDARTDFDADGKVEKRAERLYEIYPSVGGSPSYRRLLSVDGVAVSRAVLAEADRKYRQDVTNWAHERAHETPKDREKREDRERADRREQQRVIDEGFRITDIQIVGREMIRGRPTIVLTFTPKPGANPTVEGAAMLTKIAGRAWVDEEDREFVRIEAHTVDTITYGLGILARVAAGSRAVFERQKVNGEAWLPMRTAIRANGRIALLKRVDIELRNDYSNYRKFTVGDAGSAIVPKSPR